MKKIALSPYQKLYWLEWVLAPDSSQYNTPLLFELNGQLNIIALQTALSEYLNDYQQGAKFSFLEEKEQVYQQIHDYVEVTLEQIDTRGLSKQALEETISNLSNRPFNLKTTPLFQTTLLHTGKDSYVLLLNAHHIISDALTGQYLINTLSQMYNHYVSGKMKPQLVTEQFDDYITHFEQYYSQKQSQIDLSYWQKELTNKQLSVIFQNRSSLIDNISQSQYISINNKKTEKVKILVKENKCTVFIVLAALYAILIYRYTQQSKFVITYPINTRPGKYSQVPGCFTNNVPLIIDLTDCKTILELIKNLTQQRKQTKPHQFCPLINITKMLRSNKLIKAGDHFNISIVEALIQPHSLIFDNIEGKTLSANLNSTPNDLTLAYQVTDNIRLRLNHQLSVFSQCLARQFLSDFEIILDKLLLNPLYDFQNKNYLAEKNSTTGCHIGNTKHKESHTPLEDTFSDYLSQHPMITDALVIHKQLQNNTNDYIAYCVVKEINWFSKIFGKQRRPTIHIIHDWLKQKFAHQQLPIAYVYLSSIPKDLEGKINYTLLPAPQPKDYISTEKISYTHDNVAFTLKQIWQDTLHITDIDLNEKFFSIGGYSLIAVDLMSRINQTFDTQLPVSWILTYNTIDLQADYFRQDSTQRHPYQTILTFHENEQQSPSLFLAHPGLSGAACYDEMTQYITDSISCYGIDAYHLNSDNLPMPDLISLAEYYVQQLLASSARPPYFIAGWSFGGVLAFEIAQQLSTLGIPVERLILLDSYFFSQEEIEYARQFFKVETLEKRLATRSSHYLKNIPKHYQDRVINALKQDHQLLLNYKPKRYQGKTTIIKAMHNKQLPTSAFRRPCNGWKPWIKQIDLITFEGDHYNMIYGRQSKSLAQLIQNTIEITLAEKENSYNS